jgi:hypothetical protein
MSAVSTAYTPRPGTLAFRVLGYLGTLMPGAEVPTGSIADALRCDGNLICSSMDQAVANKLVFSRQKGGHSRSPRFWSLVDHTAAPRTAPVLANARITRAAGGGVDIDTVHRRHDRVIEMEASQAGPAGDGRQTPNGDGLRGSTAPAKAGSNSPQKGANRDASAEQSHGVDTSSSGVDRGHGMPAAGAAPAFLRPNTPRDAQHVLKAESESSDATDRATPAISPRVGAMGAGQPADAGPTCDRIEVPTFLKPRMTARLRAGTAPPNEVEKPEVPAVRITLSIECTTLHQVERITRFVRQMNEVQA